MAKAGRKGGHALLFGHTTHGIEEDKEFLAYQLCDDYIARRVSGVFFAPLEGIENKDAVNVSITERLSAAGIAVVLLDRCIYSWPHRSRFDLVGIDNRRAGNLVTRHLLNRGVARPAFLARPYSAPTVDLRYAGFVDALRAQGLEPGEMIQCQPDDQPFLQRIMETRNPNAFVCANDVTAAILMQTLEKMGLDVPRDVKVTGFDDVSYSTLLRVPITSVRQPCHELGEMAILAMLSRLERPDLPARDILLDCNLVVRDSSGFAG
jgi:DNA-binding LacI/PurR family transcriptional regulator